MRKGGREVLLIPLYCWSLLCIWPLLLTVKGSPLSSDHSGNTLRQASPCQGKRPQRTLQAENLFHLWQSWVSTLVQVRVCMYVCTCVDVCTCLHVCIWSGYFIYMCVCMLHATCVHPFVLYVSYICVFSHMDVLLWQLSLSVQ